MRTFERWCWTMDFLGGSRDVKYPRWLRRLYIVTWPIAAPVRMMLFALDAILFFIVIGSLGGLICAALWVTETAEDFFSYFSRQWHGEP